MASRLGVTKAADGSIRYFGLTPYPRRMTDGNLATAGSVAGQPPPRDWAKFLVENEEAISGSTSTA